MIHNLLNDAAAVWPPLLAACILTIPLGAEREATRKPAGLRTHMLVSLGAAGFVLAATTSNDANDQLRALQGVATGIGFVGAGAIIQSRHHVRGLTTAVSVWIAAAIGATCGLRDYHIATALTLLTLAVLLVDRIPALHHGADPEQPPQNPTQSPDQRH